MATPSLVVNAHIMPASKKKPDKKLANKNDPIPSKVVPYPQTTAQDKYVPPGPDELIASAAHSERIHATRKWVAGEISSKKHEQVHKRAEQAIKKHGGSMKKMGRGW